MKKHSFDVLRDVCIYCHAPRQRVEETQSMTCDGNNPTRDWILARATVQVKMPVIMSPAQDG